MAKDGEDRRFFGGPRALGALLPRLTRPAFKRRSPAGAALMADWAAVVGPDVAAIAAPRRLGNGTLVIGCAGPAAIDRYGVHGVDIPASKFEIVGRPQVETVRPAGGSGPPTTVLYAPTWRGHVSETLLYSLPQGEKIVRSLLERVIEEHEMAGFSEVFLTGTAAEVTPVREIQGMSFTPGRVTETLLRDYEALVRMSPDEVSRLAA